MKKCITLAMIATLLFSSMTVNAAEESMTAKQNADYMMQTNADGAPNWFNGTYYSNRHDDLKFAFGNNEKALYNHSLSYGFNESRLVSPVLDVVKYRAFYPDLEKAFENNWNLYVRHYFEYGINEGRNNFTDFDAKTYLNMYEDLQNAFGDDLGLATRHYIEYGYTEGRLYNWPEPEIDEEADIDDSDSFSGSDNSGSDGTIVPDAGSTDENFTGEKRVDSLDGTYRIDTYENGKLTIQRFYDSSNNLLNETTYYATQTIKTDTHYRSDGTKFYYYEYDEQGKATLLIEYQNDGKTEDYKVTYAYDENGIIKSDKVTWSNGASAETTYENGVRVYQVDIHADGTRAEAEFYADGDASKKVTEIRLDGTKTISEFYENGNWKSFIDYDADGNITHEYYYDENGELITNDDNSSAVSE